MNRSAQNTDDDILAIDDRWHVRTNAGAGLAYVFSNDDYMYSLLSPYEMVALAFCNGKNTRSQVRTLLSEVVGLSEDDSQNIIQGLVTHYHGREPILVLCIDTAGTVATINAARILHELSLGRMTDSETARLDVPLTLLLIPTYHCLTDCIYCYSQRPEISRDDEMPVERWMEIIDEAGSLGIDRVTFSGGDPLMYKGILNLLEISARYRMCYILPTKTTIKPKRARALARVLSVHGEIQISVDSFDHDIAAFMTRTPGYADHARQSIMNLRDAGVRVTTNTVVTPHNYSTIADLVYELKELGVHKANVTNYNRSAYRHDDSLLLSPEQITELNHTVSEIRDELNWELLSCNAEARDFSVPGNNTVEAWNERASCSGGFSAMCLLPNGDVTLCEQAPDEEQFVVGNVRESSLMEIWNSQRLLDFISPDRSCFVDTACAECDEFDACHRIVGRCFKDSYFTYGRLFFPSPNCPKAPPGLRLA